MSKAHRPADQQRRLTVATVAEDLIAIADAFAVEAEDVRGGSFRLATESMPAPVPDECHLSGTKRLRRLAGLESQGTVRDHVEPQMPLQRRQRTWNAAVDGVRAAYVSFQPDLAVPGAPETVGAFARTVVQAGVQRLVLLSGRGEEEALRAERIVQASGAEVTVLRCSWFTQNFTEGSFLPDVLSGEVALPVGTVREPFLDADDIADAAVIALLEDGHAGRVYELTGPRLMTFHEAVAQIALASGRSITLRTVPLPEYAAVLSEVGVPADEVALLKYLFGEVLDGRNESVTDGVRRVLGRPARDPSDHLRTVLHRGGTPRMSLPTCQTPVAL
jgi:uncharacterized protein YbjT (DUF2867 family)